MKYSFTFEEFIADIPFVNIHISMPHPIPYYLTFGSVVLYCFLIFVIFPMFTPKSEEGRKRLEKNAKVHFALLFVYSGIAFSATLYHIIQAGEIYDFQAYFCNPVPAWLRFLSLTFIVSKMWEWGDTAIDIWRGKTVSKIGFLHCYHHATTFFLFLLVQNFPGTEKAGMLLNGFVHTLMYYHYAFRLPRAFRPFITAAQIVQLITVTYLWHVTPATCTQNATFPKDHYLEFLFPYLFVPVYCIFFVKFFVESYLFPQRKGEGKSGKTSSDGHKKVK